MKEIKKRVERLKNDDLSFWNLDISNPSIIKEHCNNLSSTYQQKGLKLVELDFEKLIPHFGTLYEANFYKNKKLNSDDYDVYKTILTEWEEKILLTPPLRWICNPA